jgi:hypothetical protein
MPDREEASAATRHLYYTNRLAGAPDARGELWVAYGWVVAEAGRVSRLDDATRATLGIVALLQTGEPIPDELLQAARAMFEDQTMPTPRVRVIDNMPVGHRRA